MSSKVVVLLEDDLDGTKADETIEFGLDGATYIIDLSDANAKKLRDELAPWVAAARKTGGRRAAKVSSGVDNTAVRAWAEANGIEVSKRGRISQDVVSQFRAAGN
jgi:Lsr2